MSPLLFLGLGMGLLAISKKKSAARRPTHYSWEGATPVDPDLEGGYTSTEEGFDPNLLGAEEARMDMAEEAYGDAIEDGLSPRDAALEAIEVYKEQGGSDPSVLDAIANWAQDDQSILASSDL